MVKTLPRRKADNEAHREVKCRKEGSGHSGVGIMVKNLVLSSKLHNSKQ